MISPCRNRRRISTVSKRINSFYISNWKFQFSDKQQRSEPELWIATGRHCVEMPIQAPNIHWLNITTQVKRLFIPSRFLPHRDIPYYHPVLYSYRMRAHASNTSTSYYIRSIVNSSLQSIFTLYETCVRFSVASAPHAFTKCFRFHSKRWKQKTLSTTLIMKSPFP